MTKLEELEKSVAALPKAELDQFANWFDELRATQWDAQIELDGNHAGLNALADAALRDHHTGRPFESTYSSYRVVIPAAV